MSLFSNLGIDIAELVNQNISPSMIPATLIKVESAGIGPDPGVGGNTETLHIGKGMIEDYKEDAINGTSIQLGDKKVLLIANSFVSKPVPEGGDKITIENKTWSLVRVIERDPAGATYLCQVRG